MAMTQGGNFDALVGREIFFATASFFIGKPSQNEGFVHSRAERCVVLLPLLMGECPSSSPSTDAIHFELILLGNLFVLQSIVSGENDLHSFFLKLGNRKFAKDFLDLF